MKKGKQRETLIGMVIMLGTVLCLLVAIALHFEYGRIGGAETEKQENTSLLPIESAANAISDTGEHEGYGVPENNGDGREEKFGKDPNVNKPSDGKENGDNQEGTSTPADSEAAPSKPEEVETTATISVHTEATQPTQGDEAQEKVTPPETESEETTLPNTESAEESTNRCEGGEY